MTVKRMTKKYISILKTNTSLDSSLQFRLKKIDETRNYVLDEIKHIGLMSEKFKKTCKYFCICFISLCSCWYCKFCSRITNLCNYCMNQKV